MKLKINVSNILAILISLVCFWYVSYSYERSYIGIKANKYYLDSNPILFWFWGLLIIGFALYMLYLVLSGKGEERK